MARSANKRSDFSLKSGPGNDWLPAVFRTKLRFNCQFFTAASATPWQAALYANSGKDCSAAHGTDSAAGFVELALLYQQQYVRASKIHVWANCEGKTTGLGLPAVGSQLVLWPSVGATAVTTIANASAQAGAKQLEFSTTESRQLSHSIDICSLVGRRKTEPSDGLASAVTTVPGNLVYWNMLWANSAAETNMETHVNVIIEYDIEFSRRYTVAMATLDRLKHALCMEQKERADSLQVVAARLLELKVAASADSKSQSPESKASVMDDDTHVVMPLTPAVRALLAGELSDNNRRAGAAPPIRK